MALNCDSCGARLSQGASYCDLCGTPLNRLVDNLESRGERPVSSQSSGLGQQTGPSQPSGLDQQTGPSQPSGSTAPSGPSEPENGGFFEGGPFCNECGWKNPAGAKYCSRCGSALQTGVTRAASSERPLPEKKKVREQPLTASPTDSSAVGRQIGIIVGAAVLLVVALYMITAMSGGAGDTSSPTPAAAELEPQGPLAPQFQAREAELKAAIDAVSSEERTELRRDLIDLYLSAARLDLAAQQQEELALEENSENAWAVAGNFYYDYMESRQGAARSAAAKKAIAAYQRALEINPDNLDIRTDMAIAYMYDPDNPMLAITETNRVLEADSLHIQANFNRGIMLQQINRTDEARAQFEKVKRIVGDPNDPVYIRAQQALDIFSQ